jgi:uncharacterized protein (TIGR00369 family)
MSKTQFLPTYKGCLVCGQPEENQSTLNLRFRVVKNGVETPFKADSRQTGYEKIVHGGVICSLLDETIGWAVAVDIKKYFVTGELNVRFVKPLPIDLAVTVRGRCLEHKSRYSIAGGEIVDAEGNIYAKATGKFFLMPDDDAKKVDLYLTYQENDLHVLSD